VLIALVVSGGVVAGYLWARGVDQNMRREDAFSALQDRPGKVVSGATNILMLGTDSGNPDNGGESSSQRTDTIAILHIPAGAKRVFIVSLPRDLWVNIPRKSGATMSKINAAYAWGGLPLTVATVEQYTGVHIDHVARVDFAGFVAITDALGGVDMTVDQTITSIHPPYRTFPAGTHHFSGDEALDYVRQRYQFTDGDFARMRHQQMFLKALLDKAAGLGTLSSLGSLRSFVNSVAGTMTVDQNFSIVDLGWQLRGLRSNDVVFMISPHKGTATMNGQSVVMPDKQKAADLFNAMARDRLDDWIAANGTPD
jgi:LCP family protein required for cell wall assembly